MNRHKWITRSLSASPNREEIFSILDAALEAVNPATSVKRKLDYQGNQLVIDGTIYEFETIRHVWVIAIGKASLAMAEGVNEVLAGRITGGIVLSKFLPPHTNLDLERYQLFTGGHPIPDEKSISGSEAILNLLATLSPQDLVIFLVSGGGSALLAAPVENISLRDLQSLNQILLACGATIQEINTLRKHLSRVKGGHLARLAAPAQVATLILSDVIGDPLEVIASGPTVPDPTTFQDAVDILQKYQIANEIPPAIHDYLTLGAEGKKPETPKAKDSLYKRVQNTIIANNYQAARAAANQAQLLGFNPVVLSSYLQGEAREVGKVLAAVARQIASTNEPVPQPACLIAGGETTVTLLGDGLGGRNQELALAAVPHLAGLFNTVFIALATDGEDGPTNAAGAVVTGETLSRAIKIGLDPADFLVRNDAYHFFKALDDLLIPGPTGTNVCDLVFIFNKG